MRKNIMESFKGNSDASKTSAERRVTEPVTNDVKVKTNSVASKFFAQDLKTTAHGVTKDIMIPGIKNLIVNVLKKAVDYLFLGGSAQNTNGYTNYSSPFGVARNVTYSSGFGQTQYNTPRPAPVNATRSSIYAVNDVIFTERGDAEEVLSQMNGLIQRYGMVSVLDFYDLIGQKCNPTDNKYGWKDLSASAVLRSYDGYKIDFPRIIALED